MSNSSCIGLEENKRIALNFLGHSFKGEKDEAMALLAPDATWWVIGRADKLRVSGLNDMPKISRILEYIQRTFPDGMKATYGDVTAEGDRVAVEASATAYTRDGQQYKNRYHFLLQVNDRHVTHIREYMDTQFVYEFQESEKKPRISF